MALSARLWARLRDARYAAPGMIGRWVPGPDAASAARACRRLARQGCSATAGYFAPDYASPSQIVAAYHAVSDELQRGGTEAYLSVKAPQLGFDPGALAEIVAAGREVVLDAHGPAQADATLALAEKLGTGCVLAARWQRSADDADRLRNGPARLRLVKGEWADPAGEQPDPAASFLALAERLAGRHAPVAVATHDPDLARRAIILLRQAGTPCELEQLHGLPRRRGVAMARELDVPVRVYVPFGPGWWPYAINQALARPYLPRWWLNDLLG